MEKGYAMDQALAEASRCLLCHDGPCSKGCPAGTEPDRFIRKLRFKNLKGAVAVIKTNNVLGGTCAAVCPTHSLCEKECLTSGIGEPIRISKIQRFLVEYGWQIGFEPPAPAPPNGKRVAVVGAGPSGLTCAAELARQGYSAVIFEKLPKAGGILQYVIPDHRLSREFLDREIEDVLALGVEIRHKSRIDSRADLDRLFTEGFRAVFMALGAWMCTDLDLPHRAAKGVFDALTFLGLAKEDPTGFVRLAEGREVAVIGGGDTAVDAAVTAQKGGAWSVSLIYRRSFNDMPGSREEKEFAMREGVHFVTLTQPVDYVIADGRVKGLTVVRNRLGDLDETLRRKPVPIEGSQHFIQADTIVEALGQVPDEAIKRFTGLASDDQNYIVLQDDDGRTSLDGVFAGGDAVRGGSLVARAVADGKRAAAAIAEALGDPSGCRSGSEG